MIAAILKPFMPWVIGAGLLLAWTYGNRWQAVQAYKHKVEVAAAATQATATESFRRDEIKANNAKDTYEKEIQNQRIDSKRLDAVLDRLRNTASATCAADTAPADTSGATRAAAPQFEW